MSIVLARVDSRLVHGQVLEAWVPSVKADCIVVANDAVADNDFQRSILQAAVPSSIKLVIGSLEDTAEILNSAQMLKKRVLLLFIDATDALRAQKMGVTYSKLNLGNMHSGEATNRYSCTIALASRDIENLREIEERGVTIVAQCVPSDREQGWHKLIRFEEQGQ